MPEDMDTLYRSLLARQSARRLPPVRAWQPASVRAIDLRIAADGTWYYLGTPILRPAMVRLFSTVLRRDPDGYCLVTPAEKLLIRVDDAPFTGVALTVAGDGHARQLLLTTNVDDHVPIDAAHALRLDGSVAQPRPYVQVRDGLDALLSRAVYYELVALAEEEGGELVVHGNGMRWVLGPAA
jgi:hypothetical protein